MGVHFDPMSLGSSIDGKQKGLFSLGLPCTCTCCSLADFEYLLRILNVKQKLINKCIFGFINFNRKGEAFHGLLYYIVGEATFKFSQVAMVAEIASKSRPSRPRFSSCLQYDCCIYQMRFAYILRRLQLASSTQNIKPLL